MRAQAFRDRLEVFDIIIGAVVGRRAVVVLAVARIAQDRECALVKQRHIVGQRGLQAGAHVAQLTAVEFRAAAPLKLLGDAGDALLVLFEALAQPLGHRHAAGRVGQQRFHLAHGFKVAEQHVLAHQQRGLPGQVGRDGGVAVGVAAHPGTESDWGRRVGGAGPARLAQGGDHGRRRVPQRRLEGAQQQARLLERGGTPVAQVVRLPEHLDVGGDSGVDRGAVRLGGGVAFEQQGVERAERLLHREPLRLGGVRGEDGLHAQVGGGLANRLAGHVAAAHSLDRLGERAGRGEAFASVGEMPPHAVRLFGGVGQQEVGEEGVADLGGERERPAADQLDHLGAELGLRLAAHAAAALRQVAQLLDGFVDLPPVDRGDRAPEHVAEQPHIARQRSVDLAPINSGAGCGHRHGKFLLLVSAIL